MNQDYVKRLKHLESLPKLTKEQRQELKLWRILLDNFNRITIYLNKKNTDNDEEMQYLIYHSEIIFNMLKNHAYKDPLF